MKQLRPEFGNNATLLANSREFVLVSWRAGNLLKPQQALSGAANPLFPDAEAQKEPRNEQMCVTIIWHAWLQLDRVDDCCPRLWPSHIMCLPDLSFKVPATNKLYPELDSRRAGSFLPPSGLAFGLSLSCTTAALSRHVSITMTFQVKSLPQWKEFPSYTSYFLS